MIDLAKIFKTEEKLVAEIIEDIRNNSFYIQMMKRQKFVSIVDLSTDM